MTQIIIKVVITSVVTIIFIFVLHRTWTHEIDIVRLFKKPSDVIPVKEKVKAEPASRAIQEEILEKTNKQTEEAKKQTRLLERLEKTELADHGNFIKEYELGYALFAVEDGRKIIKGRDTEELEKRMYVNWTDTKITEFTDESITIQLSNLINRRSGGSRIMMPFGLSIRRKTDNKSGGRLIIDGIEVSTKLLYDDGKDIICLVGFRDIGH